MNIKGRHIILLFILGFTVFTSCKKVVVQVDSLPANTPPNQPVYITGNFNNWDPGDERYVMQLNNDSTYSIELPPGFGTVEYKFTRGDWTTVEKDICGYEIDDRTFLITENDTVNNQIASWNDLDPLDCPRVTLVLNNLPEDTPNTDDLYLIGNINSWNSDNAVPIVKNEAGKYSITIDRPPSIGKLEFKITRGDLTTSEADEFGNDIPNRILPFGIKDTVELNVEGWVDKAARKGANRVIFIIKSLPENTPAYEEIYLASSLNNWMPGDRNYIFQKNVNGDFFFPFPRKKENVEFKITRGSWFTSEVDNFGYDTPNRYVNLLTVDTVFIEVQGWKDLTGINDNELTIVINKLPSTTPSSAHLFLAGDVNNWNPNRNKHRFEKLKNGSYALNIERKRHSLEFKITRGSWNSIEVDDVGIDGQNRKCFFKDYDTLYIQVDNWRDKPVKELENVVLVIDKLPSNTPMLDDIYLAPDFNGWDPMDKNLIFDKLPDGRPFIILTAKKEATEYKITRGGWSKVEVDEFGQSIPDRRLNYGFSDTLHIEVIKWRDFDGEY